MTPAPNLLVRTSDGPLAPLAPRAFDRRAAAHLLDRAALGASPAALEEALTAGPRAAVERLFADSEGTRPAGAIETLLGAGELDLLQAWWMRGLCSGPGPLRERATLMWHAHFATSHQKVRDVRLMHAQNATQRSLALGPFDELLRAMLLDPALLVWLDGTENRVGAPNENLARELLELFGLGRGNYTEDDVRELARALTGWDVRGRRAVFVEALHDPGPKQFLGRTEANGVEDAVGAVLEHPACSRWIARRLISAYVGPAAPPELEAALADELAANDLHVGHALERLLGSRGFHAAGVVGTRIASPVETLARASRALGVALAPRRAVRLAERMGQSLFQPPTVAGWDGGRTWLDAAAWVARRDAARELARRVDPAPDLGSALATLLPGRERPDWAEALGTGQDRAPTDALELVLGSPEFQLH